MNTARKSNGEIKRVLVVDDDADAREALSYPIEDLGITPVMEDGPIESPEQFVEGAAQRAQAVVCDYRLKTSGAYSKFDGDELLAACFRRGIPGLLYTQYTDVVTEMDRRLRRFIPSLLKTSSPKPADILAALGRCRDELDGSVHPARSPWRTLIRVVDVCDDGDYCHVVVPGWSYDQVIRLYLRDLPEAIRPRITKGAYLHAKVNIGAHSFDELYFDEWEPE